MSLKSKILTAIVFWFLADKENGDLFQRRNELLDLISHVNVNQCQYQFGFTYMTFSRLL